MAETKDQDYELRRDVGSGAQLPYGAATELARADAEGEAAAAALEASAVVPPTAVPRPSDTPVPPDEAEEEVAEDVVYAEDTEDGVDDFEPASDDEEVLFGPREGVSLRPTSPWGVSRSVVRALPALAVLARDPSTPAVVRAAYRIALERIEASLEEAGA